MSTDTENEASPGIGDELWNADPYSTKDPFWLLDLLISQSVLADSRIGRLGYLFPIFRGMHEGFRKQIFALEEKLRSTQAHLVHERERTELLETQVIHLERVKERLDSEVRKWKDENG